MPRPLRSNEMVDRLRRITTDLDGLHPERTSDALRDFSAGPGSGGGPSPKNQISDPTGNAALSRDSWAMMRVEMSQIINRMVLDASRLVSIEREVLAPPPPKAPVDRGLVKCCNVHGCPDDAWAIKAGRCIACYEALRRTERDRPGQPVRNA
jgi:hypothetical protein